MNALDFMQRLDPGRASTVAAARPALRSLMAPSSQASQASLTSPVASSWSPLAGGLPGDLGAGSDGVAAPLREGLVPPGKGAPIASFGGAQRGPIQAARPAASAASVGLEPAGMRAAPAVPVLRPNAARLAPVTPVPSETSNAAPQSAAPLRPQRIEPAHAQAQAQALTQLRAAAAVLASGRSAWPLDAEPDQPMSAAALQARASASPAALAAPAPALHVTIDRIEVRAAAAAPKAAPAQRQPKPPAVSLADYLRSGARSKVAP